MICKGPHFPPSHFSPNPKHNNGIFDIHLTLLIALFHRPLSPPIHSLTMSKSPSLRRIQADIRELSIDPSDQYHAAPLEHDMFEWHFTIRGAPGTDFEGGVYHGRILLPPEYPFKPPNIVFMTPSGRFETNTKVCLSFSSFHPELWQPAWGIRLILEALISFLPTPADGAIGALDWTKEERVKLAKESVKFRCPVCCEAGKTCVDLLPEVKAKNDEGKRTKFHEEIEKLKMLQFQNHAAEDEEKEANDLGDKDSDDEKPAESAEAGEAQELESSENKSAKAEKTETELDKSTTEQHVEKSKEIPPSPASNAKQSEQKANAPSTTVEATNSTPAPAPADTSTQAPPNTSASPTDNSTPPAPTESSPLMAALEGAPLVSDNCLNGMIAVLAIVVVVLLRQASELVDELRSLEK